MPFFWPYMDVACTTLSMMPVSASRSKKFVESDVSSGASCEWSYTLAGAMDDWTRMLANSFEKGISARVVSQPTPANSVLSDVATAAAIARRGMLA